MKKNILVLIALALTVFGMVLPLNLAFAMVPSGSPGAAVSRQVQARAGTKAVNQQDPAAQASDPCANDTPDDQEVNDGADNDTDKVELQCGDQSGPDDQSEGASETDSAENETADDDATEQATPAQSK